MKKLTTLALATMMLAPSASFAYSYEKVVTNGTELKTALNALGSGVAGETYTIICDWDAADQQKVGRIKPTMTKGTLIIRSNQTNFAKMPQVALSFQWAADGERGEAKQNLSIIFENMVIDANQDSYFIDHRRAMFADTIAIRNCDISNFKRSCLRFDGDKHEAPIDETTGEKITRSQMSIDVIDIQNSVIHNSAQRGSDNWSVFRTFMPVNTFNIENCLFYDSPYTKSLWETRDVNENPTTMNFNNNMALLGQNKTLAPTGFTMLMPSAYIAPGSVFYINNNIIAAPRKGQNILHNDTTTYTNDAKLISVSGAVIYAAGNIIDTTAFVALDKLADAMLMQEVPTVIVQENNKVFDDYNVDWNQGKTFLNAEYDEYIMEKTNPWYTAGVVNSEYGADNTYVGPSIAYVDEHPTIAAVNVTIDGPEYVTYTITPEKEYYYTGEKVTVTFNDQNSYYRTITNFKGWSDGGTEATRTFVLKNDLNVTATFEPAIENLLSFFNFSGAISDTVYQADVYTDESYRANVYMMVADTTMGAVAPYNYVMASTANTFTKNGSTFSIAQDMRFQRRAAKLSGDEAELQMSIINRRSSAAGHTAGQPNYAMFKFSTKHRANINFSCYVGTDNFMFATQKLEYSLDGQTWEAFATVDMTDAKRELDFGGVTGQVYGWKELAGVLPAAAENQEVVYVRVISDPTSTALFNSVAQPDPKTADSHEYIGQVLITASEYVEPDYSTTNVLGVQDTEVFTGSAFSFPASMTNENSITAFQCDVYLSDGLMMNLNDEGEYDVTLNAARKTSSHSVATSLQSDGAIRIISYSTSNKAFKGNSGELFNLNLTALDEAGENQTVEIRNIRVSTADETEYSVANAKATVTVKSYTPADVNGDGQITIVDVVAVVNALMGTTTGNFIFDAADMDQNGEITIVDVVAVVNALMGNSTQALTARSILHSDIHVADTEVNVGETTTLYVKLDHAQAYTAMQMDVNLPEGLSIKGVEMVGNPSHTVVYNEKGRIAAYSLNNSRFNDGETLMAVTVKADKTFAGTAQADFTNVRVVSTGMVETVLAGASASIAGGGANGIDGVTTDENVQVLYYSTTGAVSDTPHKGLNIIKRIYGDGRVIISKGVDL